MDTSLTVAERAARDTENKTSGDHIGKRVIKAAGFVGLSGVGLLIGTLLGVIAALMLGLIAIC